MANLQLRSVSCEDTLKGAFEFYDTDHNGVITLEEVRKVFGDICDETTLKRLISDIDSKNTGGVSL